MSTNVDFFYRQGKWLYQVRNFHQKRVEALENEAKKCEEKGWHIAAAGLRNAIANHMVVINRVEQWGTEQYSKVNGAVFKL